MSEVIYRYDPERRRDHPAPGDADEACRHLEAGNRAFASMATGKAATPRIVQLDAEDYGMAEPGSVPVQQPFAAVLGCADARVPIEMIFDRMPNELFVLRVAGNIISQELLGSIDYAVEHLGRSLKLIVVLGHSQCGAVTAAVDAYLVPAEYLGLSTFHYLRSIVNILFPPVRGAARVLEIRWGDAVSKLPGYRAALIECSVIINAALTASILRCTYGAQAKDRRVVFGVYDLASRRVHVPLSPEDGDEPPVRLLDAPVGREEVREFASRLAGSAFITGLLHKGVMGTGAAQRSAVGGREDVVPTPREEGE